MTGKYIFHKLRGDTSPEGLRKRITAKQKEIDRLTPKRDANFHCEEYLRNCGLEYQARRYNHKAVMLAHKIDYLKLQKQVLCNVLAEKEGNKH